MKGLLVSLVLLAVGSLSPAEADQAAAGAEKKGGDTTGAVGERVRKLFAAMRAGRYDEVDFPKLGWEEIPGLLEVGSSTTALTTFPRSPLSSQYEAECSEGMVALWLVEGLRKGGQFGSLNALCLPVGAAGGDWRALSEKSHAGVLRAYRDWWRRVQSLPRDKAAAVDPLQGAELHWH